MTLQEYFKDWHGRPISVDIRNCKDELIADGNLCFQANDYVELLLFSGDSSNTKIPLSLNGEDDGDGMFRTILNKEDVFLHFFFC